MRGDSDLDAADIARIAEAAIAGMGGGGFHAARPDLTHYLKRALLGALEPVLRECEAIAEARLTPTRVFDAATFDSDVEHTGGLEAEEFAGGHQIEGRLEQGVVLRLVSDALRRAVFVIHHVGIALRIDVEPVNLTRDRKRLIERH